MRQALVLLAACRPLPDHLRLDPAPTSRPDSSVPTAPIIDRASALAAVIGSDPLARTPRYHGDAAAIEPLPGTEGIAAFIGALRDVEVGREPLDRTMIELETLHPDTEAVALSRGYRLQVAENQLLGTLQDPRDAQREVVSLITPLRLGTDDPSNARMPLDFLQPTPGVEQLLAYGERWVATGWLAGPGIPLSVVAASLAAPQYDALRGRPIGRLIVARGTHATADVTSAFADLALATDLALHRAAADRDDEQGAWADERKRAAATLGEGVKDPIPALLDRAFEGLLKDAGTDRSAGAALLALGALRWEEACADAPCEGLDRMETIQRAGRWDPAVAALADVWEIAEWDEVIATMAAGRETSLFPSAVEDLADLLAATGGPVDAAILTKARPDATVWLASARALGEEGVTDWQGAHVVLGRYLQAEARRIGATASPERKPFLERIASRAVP